MQTCLLCKTQYNNNTKVCPLKHCPNCGSLNLHFHNKRSFQNSRTKQNFVFIIPPLGFFVLVYGYLFVQGDLILFLSIVAVYSVFFISILFKITKKNIDCKECNASNFPFTSDINLNLNKQNKAFTDDEDLKKITQTILERISKEQKKHNRKDLIIRVFGAISLITIAILGTFFVNPDDVLLGEIISMIKSLQ